ncbi:MAG: hypothetical protein Fur0041_01400 [Bacteroidia bacterium]
MKNLLTFAFSGLLLWSSCSSPDYSKELAEIDALRVTVVRTDSVLKRIDKERAELLHKEISTNAQYIQFNVNKLKDTLDKNTAFLLTEYKALRKEFELVADQHKKLSAALDSINMSLDNLQHDLKNKSLAEGLVAADCVKKESEQVNEAYKIAGEMRSIYDQSLIAFDSLSPKVKDYIQVMNSKLMLQK